MPITPYTIPMSHPSARYTLAFTVAALSVMAASAMAQTPVHWSAEAPSRPGHLGAAISITLTATIDPGWHVYALTQGQGGPVPLRIRVPQGQPFTLGGTVEGPAPSVQFDPNFGIQVETYVDTATFSVPLAIASSARSGTQTARIAARFQVCNETLCLPPQTVTLAVPVVVTSDVTRGHP